MLRLDLEGPEGVRWVPDVLTGTGVLVLAGSSGRIDARRAELFAELGCISESVRWFGGPGQNAGPWEIPLETFFDRIRSLKKECDRVIVVGTSFGSEAALLSAAHSGDVDGVVAFAPSDVVWAGYDDKSRETSHWTLDGEPLPYVPFDFDDFVEEHPARFRPLYERSRRTASERVASATIPTDRIQNLILVAGDDDQVWPSRAHASEILSLRSEMGLETTMVTDALAGHRAILPGEQVIAGGMNMQRGGTEDADRRLGANAWAAITLMLNHLHAS